MVSLIKLYLNEQVQFSDNKRLPIFNFPSHSIQKIILFWLLVFFKGIGDWTRGLFRGHSQGYIENSTSAILLLISFPPRLGRGSNAELSFHRA